MKQKINWCILLWAIFLILITSDIKNLKYFPNLLRELKRLCRKHSIYIEDDEFILIHKSKAKNL